MTRPSSDTAEEIERLRADIARLHERPGYSECEASAVVLRCDGQQAQEAAAHRFLRAEGATLRDPVLINTLVGLFGKVHGGSFTEAQVQVVLLTDAVTNASAWPVAFHSTLALKEGIQPADVQAIREGRLSKDRKFAALSAVAKTMIEKRGRLKDEDVDRFLAAGFGKDHLLEVIADLP